MKFFGIVPTKKIPAGIGWDSGSWWVAGAKNPLLSGFTDGLKKFTHHLTHHKILAGRRGFKCNFLIPLADIFLQSIRKRVKTSKTPFFSHLLFYLAVQKFCTRKKIVKDAV